VGPAAPLVLVGPTVREYVEQWLTIREHIETVVDDAARLRNHVFDLRRTFITLAQEDGGHRDVLKVITHAPDAADVMSLYTTYPWPTLCAEVAKLQIGLPEPSAPRVVANRPGRTLSVPPGPPRRRARS
jgi:hypothetical protein